MIRVYIAQFLACLPNWVQFPDVYRSQHLGSAVRRAEGTSRSSSATYPETTDKQEKMILLYCWVVLGCFYLILFYLCIFFLLTIDLTGVCEWRDDSAFKSPGCSFKGPVFKSQHPPVIPVSGDLSLLRTSVFTACTLYT